MGAPLGYLGAGALQGAATAEQTRHERHEAELAYGLKAADQGLRQQEFHEATRQQKIATATALWNAAHTRMGQADFPFIPQSEQDYYHQLDAQGTQLFREAGFNIPDSPGAGPAQQPVAPQGPAPDLSHYQQGTDAQMAGGATPPAPQQPGISMSVTPATGPPPQGAPHPFGLASYPGVSLPNATNPRQEQQTLDNLPPNLRALLLQGGQQPGGVEADLVPPQQAGQLNPQGGQPPPNQPSPPPGGGLPGQPGLDVNAIFGDLSKLPPASRLYAIEQMQRLQEGQAGIAHTTAQAREQNALADQGPAEIQMKQALAALYGAQGGMAQQELAHYAQMLDNQGKHIQAELIRAIAGAHAETQNSDTQRMEADEKARQNRESNALAWAGLSATQGKNAHQFALDAITHALPPVEVQELGQLVKSIYNVQPMTGVKTLNQDALNRIQAISKRHPEVQAAIDFLQKQVIDSGAGIGAPGPAGAAGGQPAIPPPAGVDPHQWALSLDVARDPAKAQMLMNNPSFSTDGKALLKRAMGALQQGVGKASPPRGAARRKLPAGVILSNGQPVGRIGDLP